MCHMFLYTGREVWGKTLGVRRFHDNKNPLPVQCWTYLWDKDYDTLDYIMFQEFFVRKMMAYLGEHRERIPKEI